MCQVVNDKVWIAILDCQFDSIWNKQTEMEVTFVVQISRLDYTRGFNPDHEVDDTHFSTVS